MGMNEQHTLTIVIHRTGNAMAIRLGGGITELRAAKPGRPWTQEAPSQTLTKMSLDTCDATYTVLRESFKL
jgi:hypothetical protein